MMLNEMQELSVQIKSNVVQLIEKQEYVKAHQLLEQYMMMVKDDAEVFSIQALNFVKLGKLEEARKSIEAGLKVDKDSFDLLYNLGYVYELKEDLEVALRFYLRAREKLSDKVQEGLIEESLERLNGKGINGQKEKSFKLVNVHRKKIVFLVKEGLDSFLAGLIKELSRDFEVKKVIVTDLSQIEVEMSWADICWFEWCDELVAYGSQLKLAHEKAIICRIHGYEVYSDLIMKPNWLNVNQIIVVAPHILRIFNEKVERLALRNTKIDLVYCGVDLSLYSFKEHRKGYNIGYLGYLNFKKNIPLTLDIYYQLYLSDKRYKLYLAGEFQDERTLSYVKFFINEHQLQNHIIYDGWQNQEQKNIWFDKINYMLISSIDEGLCYAAAEAMAVGIKPVLHKCEGLKDHYPENYLFDTLDQAIKMITEEEYNSKEYRQYIQDFYSHRKEHELISKIIEKFNVNRINKNIEKREPLVTIGIINYNYAQYLEKCITSVLEQDYSNIEILIVDDCSTDNSLEVIERFRMDYNCIRAIKHVENSGSAVKAVQEIIQEASGEYFLISSADDLLMPNAISAFMKVFQDNPETDFVYTNVQIIDAGGNKKEVWQHKQYTDEEIIRGIFERFGSGVIPITGCMFKKAFCRNTGWTWVHDPENVVAGDTLNTLINTKNHWKYKYINQELVGYRHHDRNMTYDLKNRIKSIVSVVNYIIENFDAESYLQNFNYQENKVEIKNIQLAKYFLAMLHYYYDGHWKSWGYVSVEYDKKTIRSYVQPIVEQVLCYIKRIPNHEPWQSEAVKLKRELDKVIKR